MFPSATIELAGGKVLTLSAQGAPATYVSAMEVSTGSAPAAPWNQPWLPAGILHTGGVVGFTLSSDCLPDVGERRGCGPALSTRSSWRRPSATPCPAERCRPRPVRGDGDAGAPVRPAGAQTVRFQASSPGVTVVPSSGTLVLPASSSTAPYPRASTTLQVTASSSGTGEVRVAFSVAGGSASVPSLTVEVDSTGLSSADGWDLGRPIDGPSPRGTAMFWPCRTDDGATRDGPYRPWAHPLDRLGVSCTRWQWPVPTHCSWHEARPMVRSARS